MAMYRGKVIRMTSISDRPYPGRIRSWKARDGEQFVAVLLGVEAKDGSAPLDPVAELMEMGWTPPDNLLEAQGDEVENSEEAS